MEATVFYAWQADRSAKINRYLIREAAKAACDRITQDAATPWSVTLDSDTQGVAGMCDIPNTILDKIQKCDIFLADLTFVGSTDDSDDDPQQMPNANVVFELGYAAKCHGFDALVGVINEAFGALEGQVFDIKRRASITYCLTTSVDAQNRRRKRDELSEELEAAFRKALESVVSERHKRLARITDDEMMRLRTECATRVLHGQFHGFRLRPATLITIQARNSVSLDFEKVFMSISATISNPRASGEAIAWGDKFQTIELNLDDAVLYQAFGGDYEAFKNLYSSSMHARRNTSGHPPYLLPANNLQVNLVRHVRECCQLLYDVGLKPPWNIGVSLVGAKGFQLVLGPNDTSAVIDNDQFHVPSCVVASVSDIANATATGKVLRETLNRILHKFGVPYNSCFDSRGNWNMRDIG